MCMTASAVTEVWFIYSFSNRCQESSVKSYSGTIKRQSNFNMLFSAPFILAALPYIVTASPKLRARQDLPSTYTLTAIHRGDESVHNQPIMAAKEHFYIGRNSTASCNGMGAAVVECSKKYPTEVEIADTRAALVSCPFPMKILTSSVPISLITI